MAGNMMPALNLEDDPEIEYAYRYEDRSYAVWDPWDEYDGARGSELRVELVQFPIMRHTAKGIWINHYGEPKFVNLTKNKKFALPNLTDAQVSYLARKRRQAELLEHQIKRTRKAIRIAEQMFYGEPKAVPEI